MSRTGMLIASVIAVGLIGLWGWQMLPQDEEPEAATGGASPTASFQPPPAGAVSVDAQPVRRGELVKSITANGTAEAEHLLRVAAEVQGRISAVAVVVGQWVEAGDVLVEIDDTELIMARDRAEEMYNKNIMDFANNQIDLPGAQTATVQSDGGENALQFLRRYVNEQAMRTMLRQPALEERLSELTREDLFAAIAQLTNQRVALEQAELNLRRARITAPFSGQVAGLDASSGPNRKSWPVVGQRVNAGEELVMLVDPDPIRVRVEIIESEISFVREGRGAEVTFPAYPGETFHGTIEAIDPLVDATRKTLSVTLRLPNADHRLKPGMFTQVVLDTEIFSDRLLVPVAAVLLRNDRQLVFVVRDGRAQWEYVTTGLENAEWIEILSDNLEEGDIVVTSGHFTLAHDTRVTIAEPAGSGGGD